MLTCFISIIYRFVAASENCYDNAYAAYNNVDVGIFGKFRRSVNYRNYLADVLNSHRDRITLVPFLDRNTPQDNDYRNTNLQIQAT